MAYAFAGAFVFALCMDGITMIKKKRNEKIYHKRKP